MNLQHVNVKIFVDGELNVDLEEFIKVFHRWIADQSMDELLIDVADYRHVPAGPGVVLIGHEADYSIDNNGNRFGLRYNRKAELDGANEDRLRQAFRSAAGACQSLESEFENLRFSRRQFQIFINDRMLAPNTHETFDACKGELESFLKNLLAHNNFIIEHKDDPRQLFTVEISVDEPMDLSALI